MTYYIKDEKTANFEKIVDVSFGVWLNNKMIYEKVWNYKKEIMKCMK